MGKANGEWCAVAPLTRWGLAFRFAKDFDRIEVMLPERVFELRFVELGHVAHAEGHFLLGSNSFDARLVYPR